MRREDLVVHLARFAGGLRERGVRVSLSDEVDAAEALTLVDVSDRAEVRRALAIALKIRPRDARAFEDLFEVWWAGSPPGDAALAADERRSADRAQPLARVARTQGVRGFDDRWERESLQGDTPGYSSEALLRGKPFEQCSEADLAAIERILTRLASRLATRRSRRLVPTRGRGRVDPRRSFRDAVETDGELLRLARRARAVEEPRLVVLCDTSGSMDLYSRFLLAFLLSLKKVARRTELFAFNTALVRLTPWVSASRIGSTLERLSAGVPDWSGGTKIGECLAKFVAAYLDEMVDAKTVVVIVSDGLDRGDTSALVAAMRAISSRARRVIWLNPLLGDSRYEPIQRGMAAALPYIDTLAPAHNLESLERLIPQLAA
ncbi:MAG TPA: VWA domain-containing protein [Thermoanaerobaculia bacterium]|nr:VWA domain-containing protein [Thermoanaerobaculia bacterium]